jgi:hypothetical protein
MQNFFPNFLRINDHFNRRFLDELVITLKRPIEIALIGPIIIAAGHARLITAFNDGWNACPVRSIRHKQGSTSSFALLPRCLKTVMH